MNEQDGLYSDRFARYYDQYSTGLDGDVQFYVEEAAKAGSPVMELACGTGRVLIPVAQSGVEIVGVDRSEDMLGAAREKLASLDDESSGRVDLVHGDIIVVPTTVWGHIAGFFHAVFSPVVRVARWAAL